MTADINIYNPKTLGAPLGQYCHVTRVKAKEFLFIAGSLAVDKEKNIFGPDLDFEAQCIQVFENIEKALSSAGAGWANVIQFTTYLLNSQWIPRFMDFRLQNFPTMFPDGKYPPNTC